MASFRGISRLWLPFSSTGVGRTGRTYSYRVCMFSSLDRYVPGHHTPGERVEALVSSDKNQDICMNHDSPSERTCKANGAQQHELSGDTRAVFNMVATSKRKRPPGGRRKIEIPDLSLERECKFNAEDAEQVQCFEMRTLELDGKQEPYVQHIESHLLESDSQFQLSAEHFSESHSMKQFDNADGLKESCHRCLTSGEFDSTQGSEQFGDEADTLLEVPSSSRIEETETIIKKKAYQALASRPLTALQLRKKLIGNHFPADMVEAIITELQASGLQSDYDYAETFSRSRWLSLSWGPRRIKLALMRRGVSKADAERALDLIFNDTDTDEEKQWGMSDSARKHLMAQATKKWLQAGNASFETRRTRMVWWLQYRGFNWNVIIPIVKELQSNYPALKE